MNDPPRPGAEVAGIKPRSGVVYSPGRGGTPQALGLRAVFVFLPFHAALTPLAEAAPTRDYGIRRQHVPLCVSFDAVPQRRCESGQWRQAAWNEKSRKREKNAHKPRVRGVRLTLLLPTSFGEAVASSQEKERTNLPGLVWKGRHQAAKRRLM